MGRGVMGRGPGPSWGGGQAEAGGIWGVVGGSGAVAGLGLQPSRQPGGLCGQGGCTSPGGCSPAHHRGGGQPCLAELGASGGRDPRVSARHPLLFP